MKQFTLTDLLASISIDKAPKSNNFEIALTHRSYSKEHNLSFDNEKLEFLGDAILKFSVSAMLYELFTDYQEGQLTKIRSFLVSDSQLSFLCKRLKLDKLIRLGTGIKTNKSICAQALEAFIAAIFFEYGFEKTTQTTTLIFKESALSFLAEDLDTDYKSKLQELTQVNRILPKYSVVKQSGTSHKPVFTVEVTINEIIYAQAQGASVKQAQQACAKIALQKLGAIEN